MFNLKKERLLAEKTQEDIAALLGISQTHYAKYESKRIEIPLRYLRKLADYYGTTLDYLDDRTANK